MSGPDVYASGRVGCTVVRVELYVKESIKASEFATKMQHRIIMDQKSLPKEDKLGVSSDAISYKMLCEMQEAARGRRAS